MDTQELEIEVKHFKDVHAELENEATLLCKDHNLQDFSEKAKFLKSSGFVNSIATRMYQAIVDGSKHVEEVNRRYHGQYKMVLEPQLERVCEKYDLYVRNLDLFTGDIPESNIREMMKFQIYKDDLPVQFITSVTTALSDYYKIVNEKGTNRNYQSLMWRMEDSKINVEQVTEALICAKINLAQIGIFDKFTDIVTGVKNNSWYTSNKSDILQIAAVKRMFHDEAFKDSQARIINTRFEGLARYRVNMDPIVTCNTRYNGRIIITAWGDEANDELVANQNHN